jgi:OPA family glycerol-3-phosphate transporter-like MFS transporter
MTKLQERKQVNQLTLLFTLTYLVSYVTRINYGAVISEMVSATGFTKSQLSMSLTGSFFTYGAGMIICGVIGDRVSPKKLVSLGLCLTACMNLLIPFCRTPYQMMAVWCVNGFAQSCMWPPLVRLMTTLLTPEDYKETTTKVAWGSSVGTIVIYLVSPLLITVSGWKSVFFFSAACGAIIVCVWNKYAYEIGTEQRPAAGKVNGKRSTSIFSPVMLGIMAAIVFQGMLRDGITTWMPSYISETYQLSNVVSILTGIVMPVFSILCLRVAKTLYVKRFTNPVTCGGWIFAAGILAAAGLMVFTGRNAGLSVLFSAVLTGCMHGVNLMLISMIPPFFEKEGNVSTVSGILNSCTYIGSAASTYGIAVLSERFGWDLVVLIWLIIAAVGTLLCLICAKRFMKQ